MITKDDFNLTELERACVCEAIYSLYEMQIENNEYFIGVLAKDAVAEFPIEEHNLYVYKNNILLGWIDVKDEIRPFAQSVIDYFKQRQIKTILLSGDSRFKCNEVKNELGMDTVYWQQTPQQKLAVIAELTKFAPTAMVGDGINDAAAMARSTIGIAVSDASAIARQNAQVVLVNNGIRYLPLAMQLGRDTFVTIKQNLFWAFFYNVIAIPIAAAGFLTPEIAAFAMGFSDVILVGNSLRLKWKR